MTVAAAGTGSGLSATDVQITDVTAGVFSDQSTSVTDTTVGELNQTAEIQAQNLSVTTTQRENATAPIVIGSLTVVAGENATASDVGVGLTVSASEIRDNSGIPIDDETEIGGVTISAPATVQPPETETGPQNDGSGVLPGATALICLTLIARRRAEDGE